MKLTIDRSAFLRPLGHVQSVVERRNTIPILANVLLKARNGKVQLIATDMDMDILESVSCNVLQEGSLTVPAHTLHDIVRKLPEGAEVSLEADGENNRVLVLAGRSKFTLPLLPADEFPAMSDEELPICFSLGSDDSKALIDKTRFAISNEETRYYLNGIFFHASETSDVPMLRAVATDGHRLARVEIPLPEGAKEMPNIIIPRKAITEVRKLIDDWSDDIDVSLSETKICFSIGDIILSTKLIDGTFPDYERVIPSGNDKNMCINCNDLSEAVDRVSTISTEKSRAIKLHLSSSNLVLSANSPESGTAIEELEVNYNGEMIEIGFNSRYLLDIANQIEGENVEFSMADPGSPTILRDQEDTSALYVLMPMRV